MTNYFYSLRDTTDASKSKPLIRFKRTSHDDDLDDPRNDDEEVNSVPSANSATARRSVQPDPMRNAIACRRNIAKLKRGYREGLYAELGRITQVARDFDRDEKAWARFVVHSFWNKARPQDRPHLETAKRSKIAFVTRFVFKSRTPPQCKLTSKYSGVLEFILREGVKPENMARELKKRKIGKTHRLVTKKPRPSGRKNEKPTDPIDIVEKCPLGNDRLSKKAEGAIFRWDRKARTAMKRHNRVSARVRLDCKVMEPKDGRMRLKVVGVSERK